MLALDRRKVFTQKKVTEGVLCNEFNVSYKNVNYFCKNAPSKNSCGYKTAITHPFSFIETGFGCDSCLITTSFFNMEEKPQFLFSKDNYKYFDLEINEENLFSCGISKKIDIEKNETIDLLTKKIDFDSLELRDNLNLHYNIQPFLVKIDHFSGYRVTGICQKKENFLVINQSQLRIVIRNFS